MGEHARTEAFEEAHAAYLARADADDTARAEWRRCQQRTMEAVHEAVDRCVFSLKWEREEMGETTNAVVSLIRAELFRLDDEFKHAENGGHGHAG